MSNQLTQAELMYLAKQAGFKETRWSDILGVKVESLAKFAQLIQQRQGEAPILKGVGKINGDGFKDTTNIGQITFVWNQEKPRPYRPGQYLRVGNTTWTESIDQYDFSPATVEEVETLFNQLVAQALEKAAQYVDGMVSDEDGRVILTKSTISVGIRALIDQPVEPTSQEYRQVEQGGDELVAACEELISQYESVPEFTLGGNLTNGPFLKISQALANRRGGE